MKVIIILGNNWVSPSVCIGEGNIMMKREYEIFPLISLDLTLSYQSNFICVASYIAICINIYT